MPLLASQALGFIGYVEINSSFVAGGQSRVRATSCDIKATQAVETENVVDGKIDKTVYRIGPKEVGGSLAFPAVYEDGDTVTTALWKHCLRRSPADGSLTKISAINVKYADSGAYSYSNCLVNTYEFSVAQSEVVSIKCDVIGIERSTFQASADVSQFYANRNTRVVTWNDVDLNFGTIALSSSEIRTFSVNVNNNAQRFYTLNGKLYPQDVAPTKRDIAGSISIMGRNSELANYAYQNENRCTEPSIVTFGYAVGQGVSGSGCNGSFRVALPGVVYQIEEIAITNELLETNVSFKILPGIAYYAYGNDTDFMVP